MKAPTEGACAECRQRGLIVWRGRSRKGGGAPLQAGDRGRRKCLLCEIKRSARADSWLDRHRLKSKGMEEDEWGHARNGDRLRAAKVDGHRRRQHASVFKVHMQGQSWAPLPFSQPWASQSKSCRNVGTHERLIRLESRLRWTEPNATQRPTDLFPWRTFPVAGAAAYLHICRLCFSAQSRPWAQSGRVAPRHTWSRWSSSV